MRGFFYSALIIGFLGTAAQARTGSDEQKSMPPAEAPKESGQTKEQPTASDNDQDIEAFFEDAKDQLKESGQSCQPESKPIA